jgi:hypothetical protein
MEAVLSAVAWYVLAYLDKDCEMAASKLLDP